MPTSEDLRVTIVQQLGTLSGLTALLGSVDATRRPAAYYVVGEPVSDEPIGFPRRSGTNLVQGREARIPIAAHGTSSAAALRAYLVRLLDPRDTLNRALATAGGDVVRVVGPRMVSLIYRTGHEPRWVADVVLQYAETYAGTSGVANVNAIVVDLATTGDGDDLSIPGAIIVPEA